MSEYTDGYNHIIKIARINPVLGVGLAGGGLGTGAGYLAAEEDNKLRGSITGGALGGGIGAGGTSVIRRALNNVGGSSTPAAQKGSAGTEGVQTGAPSVDETQYLAIAGKGNRFRKSEGYAPWDYNMVKDDPLEYFRRNNSFWVGSRSEYDELLSNFNVRDSPDLSDGIREGQDNLSFLYRINNKDKRVSKDKPNIFIRGDINKLNSPGDIEYLRYDDLGKLSKTQKHRFMPGRGTKGDNNDRFYASI